MTSVEIFLLAIAAVLIFGAIGERLFALTSIPDALWLLATGVVLGPVLGIAHRDMLATVAPYLGAVTIIVVLFDGGVRLDLAHTVRSAPRAAVLAFTGFALATLVVATASMAGAAIGVLPQPWGWHQAVLLGTILGGSSSVIVMPAVIRAGVAPRVAGLVSLESALTDVLCIVAASSIVELLAIGSETSVPDPVVRVTLAFGLGVGGGLAAGALGLIALRFLRGSEYTYPILLAAMFVLYALVAAAGGSAPLSILVFALMVANAKLPGFDLAKEWPGSLGPTVRGLHAMIAFFVKAFFFVFMGAMLGPLSPELLLGVAIGALLLPTRLVAVGLAMAKGGLAMPDRRLISVLLPRGLAAGVLAGLPVYVGVQGSAPIPSVTYAAVITTIVIFAVAFPLARRDRSSDPKDARPSMQVSQPRPRLDDASVDRA